MALQSEEIIKLFKALNNELSHVAISGEIYLLGGAVMCLAYKVRNSTKDIDAVFAPSQLIRNIAANIGESFGVGSNWLNDSVKGYLSEKGEFTSFLELSNLKIFVAQPQYLLAMKCLAMRLGEEFHDEEDIRFLLRYLNISVYGDAVQILKKYYPLERFPQKTFYALEEILGKKGEKII